MSAKLCERKIFISSTIRNLSNERKAVVERLCMPFEHVRFRAISSEIPESLHMSGNDIETYSEYSPNLFILNQVKYADYFLIIINDSYYGEQNIRDIHAFKKEREIISVTHAEFRAAFRQAQPIFVFIEKDTLRRYRRNPFRLKKKEKDIRIYDLIDEIWKRRKGLNVTIATYTSPQDLVNKMDEIFNSYDKSKYVYSEFDEEICRSGEEVTALWEVVNEGCVVWKNRFFKEQNTSFRRFLRESAKIILRTDRSVKFHVKLFTFCHKWFQYLGVVIRGRNSMAEHALYPVKETRPGEKVRLIVKYTTPPIPGARVSCWIMVDSAGKKIYKNLVPLEAEFFVEDTHHE